MTNLKRGSLLHLWQPSLTTLFLQVVGRHEGNFLYLNPQEN